MTLDITRLRSLLERCEAAKGSDRELDEAIMSLFHFRAKRFLGVTYVGGGRAMSNVWVSHKTGKWVSTHAHDFTASIDAAVALIEKVLPDWWHTAGLCSLTGHASIGPDYNGPAGERLKREFTVEKFDSGFDADLAPGDGPHRTCYAILHCILQALIKIEEQRAASAQEVAG